MIDVHEQAANEEEQGDVRHKPNLHNSKGSYLHKASVGFYTWHFIKSKHEANRADGKVLRHEAI